MSAGITGGPSRRRASAGGSTPCFAPTTTSPSMTAANAARWMPGGRSAGWLRPRPASGSGPSFRRSRFAIPRFSRSSPSRRTTSPGAAASRWGWGAGWWEVEHRLYGFPFPPTGTRMEMLAEQLAIVRSEWDDERFSFAGGHYRIEELEALPKPIRRPRLILGGSAGPRSAELAARWADEYNTVFATPEECRSRRLAITEAAERIGR